MEAYHEPQESITPYTNRIWTSLKYEVRNGEVEDTIWATLEVLKALTTRLEGDDLRDYTLNVTRDCVTDLATAMYANAAGRLLISVLSAKPDAFVLMVAPTVTHIKENLRHPKSPTHSLDLLKVLHVLLESRLLVTDLDMTEPQRTDFAAVDGVFKSLYADVYQTHLQLGTMAEVYEDSVKMATEAVEGVGALLSQRNVGPQGETSAFLIPESSCSEACGALFTIATRPWSDQDRNAGSDSLVNEATISLQRIVKLHPQAYGDLVSRGMTLVQHSRAASTEDAAESRRSIISLLAFVGCSTLSDPNATFSHFLQLLDAAKCELYASLNSQASTQSWCSALEGIHSVMRYFNDACLEKAATEYAQSSREFSLTRISNDYPQIAAVRDTAQESGAMDIDYQSPRLGSAKEAREDALLVGTLLCSQLYKRATKLNNVRLELGSDFQGANRHEERQYLYLLAELAGFLIREMDESQQASLQVEQFSLNLFHDKIDFAQSTSWEWLTSTILNTLSFGILESLRPSRLSKLVSYLPHLRETC